MKAEYALETPVRLVRSVHDDGTFPGKRRGDLLIRKGAVGYVKEIGVILQDQLIYQVHFIEQNMLVGCRPQELILATEAWVDSPFEFGDWVLANRRLAVEGEVLVEPSQPGQVMKVHRDVQPLQFDVLFADRLLRVPVAVLETMQQTNDVEVS